MATASTNGSSPDRRPLRVLTWHVHGSYLWYLAHVHHRIYLPVLPGRVQDYAGRTRSYEWPDNVIEVAMDDVADVAPDVVVTQSRRNWEEDRFRVLGEAARTLPCLHIEHDPPRASPTDEPHYVDDPDALVVHVTPFNRLMWDHGGRPTTVIEHGVRVPEHVAPTYDLDRGLVVVNNLARRGRRLGADVFEDVRTQVPLDLVGMGASDLGGLGELGHAELLACAGRYRFLFNPIRYTSLGLAVCEAMMLGLPVVGLATTELATVIENDVNGFVDTDLRRLTAFMRELLHDRERAAQLGAGARRTARARFSLDRFVADWETTLVALVDDGAQAVAERYACSGAPRVAVT